jgi:hypothetical protein
MSVYAVSSEIYRFFKVFMQHIECFLFGIMLTIKCFQFLVLRNKVKKLKNRKKGGKNHCVIRPCGNFTNLRNFKEI